MDMNVPQIRAKVSAVPFDAFRRRIVAGNDLDLYVVGKDRRHLQPC